MSKLYQTLQNTITSARREKDATALSIFQYLVGEIGRGRTVDTSDQNVEAVTRRVYKRLDDAIESMSCSVPFNQVAELAILKDFMDEHLPKQMSEAELNLVIDKAIEAGASNIGSVMGKIKSLGVDFDGRLASQLIRQKLA